MLLGLLKSSLFVLIPDQPVVEVLVDSNMVCLSFELYLFHDNCELLGGCGQSEGLCTESFVSDNGI